MTKAEGVITLQEKYSARMQAKDQQIDQIIPYLKNFKNEKFKYRVAEFIQWCFLQLGTFKQYNLKINCKNLCRNLQKKTKPESTVSYNSYYMIHSFL